jgi:hypothetical protein
VTKAELLKALEPFTDDIEIAFLDPESGDLFKAQFHYQLLRSGEGMFVIMQDDFLLDPMRKT